MEMSQLTNLTRVKFDIFSGKEDSEKSQLSLGIRSKNPSTPATENSVELPGDAAGGCP